MELNDSENERAQEEHFWNTVTMWLLALVLVGVTAVATSSLELVQLVATEEHA